MELERKISFEKEQESHFDERKMPYVYPLEEVAMGRYTDFKYVRVPTEQGELLLEFLRRHLLSQGE